MVNPGAVAGSTGRRKRRSSRSAEGNLFWKPANPNEQVTGSWTEMREWLGSRIEGFAHLIPQRPTWSIGEPEPPPADCPEEYFQSLVVDLMERRGWLVWHDNDPRWNDAGLPDLIAVREDRLIFIELKAERGVMRQHQELWGYLLCRVPGIEYHCFRPCDWGDLVWVIS